MTAEIQRSRILVLSLIMGLMLGGLVLAEEPVNFPDAFLKSAIESETVFTDPTPTDMATISFLDLRDRNITDLTGLEYAVNLETLWLDNNNISDLSPLAGLTKLKMLWLENNNISDISPLASLDPAGDPCSLTRLRLSGNNITDISALASLPNLERLHLGDNDISDISILSTLHSLTQVRIDNNQISNLSPLGVLTDMTWLRADNNQISDISPLATLIHLDELWLYQNQITDITALSGMTELTQLGLDNNQITDISPIANMTSLETLRLNDNQIEDISPLVGLTNLDSLTLEDNPLNAESYSTYLPQIQANNPGADVSSGYALTVNVTAGKGSVSPDSGAYDPDSTVELTATPAFGYQFVGWYDETETLLSTDNPYTVTMDRSRTIDAEFDNIDQPLNVTKLTISADKDRTRHEDKFLAVGTIEQSVLDLITDEQNEPCDIEIGLISVDSENIINGYQESLDDSIVKLKYDKNNQLLNIKYAASVKTQGKIQKFTLDLRKGKFKVIGKKIDLTGLEAPVSLEIQMGNILGVAQVTEDIINNKKLIPIALMTNVADAMRITKAKFKPEKGYLSLQGEFAVADSTVDIAAEDMTISWGSYQQDLSSSDTLIIRVGEKSVFKLKRNKTNKGLETWLSAALFDLQKNKFKIIIKDETLSTLTGNSFDFQLQFGDFDETVTVTDF